MQNPQMIINKLGLLPHPEGGYYLETYRSETAIQVAGFNGKRSAATGIYYLLESGDFSALHRIKSDETWHFYAGDPLKVVEITPKGEEIETIIGNQLDQGQLPQYTVKAGNWFGSRSIGTYSLVGCTVYPGFDFQDFEMADRGELLGQFPNLAPTLTDFTRV